MADRPRPVLGDEHDFQARVRRDPRLYALVNMIEYELHEGRITIDDAVRIGIAAANEYLMRRAHPLIVIRVEDARRAGAYFPGECARCGAGRDAPVHDPAYAGGEHAFQVPGPR